MAQERSTALFCGDKPQQRMGVFHENRRGTMRAFFFTLFMAGLCLWMPLTASAAAPAATEIISIEEYEAAIQREAAQYGIRCYVIRYDPAVQITREQLAFTLEEMRMAGGFTVQEARSPAGAAMGDDSCREGPDRSFHTVCGLFEQASLHGYETGSVSARRIGIPVRQTRPAPLGERALLFFIRCSYSCF